MFLVLAGHHHGVALNVKRDVDGIEGRIVVEMMANYQNFQDGQQADTGFMRLLQIDVDAGLMAVNTYSPSLDEHNAWEYDPEQRYGDADDEFTVEIDLNDEYDKRIETALIAPHEETTEIHHTAAGAGQTAETTWTDLHHCTDYLWWVGATADGREATSAATTFTVPGRGGRECD